LYRFTHIPDTIKPHLKTWDADFKKDKIGFVKTQNGFYTKRNEIKCDTISPNKNNFKGNLYLITDAANSSASFVLADIFKKNKLGKIVGEKTGGTLQGINGGEILFLFLPKSGIEIDIPLVFQAPVSINKDEGIIPDYIVSKTTSSILKKDDKPVSFILNKLIK
jgi:C-terminal processing protease CtpA/Prc